MSDDSLTVAEILGLVKHEISTGAIGKLEPGYEDYAVACLALQYVVTTDTEAFLQWARAPGVPELTLTLWELIRTLARFDEKYRQTHP